MPAESLLRLPSAGGLCEDEEEDDVFVDDCRDDLGDDLCDDNCHAITQCMVLVLTHGSFILRRYKWHIHAGSWSLVNCWQEGKTLPYKGCSWILMNAAVGHMDGSALMVIGVSA